MPQETATKEQTAFPPSREDPPETPPSRVPAEQSGRTSRASLIFVGLSILVSGAVLVYAAYEMTREEAARLREEATAVVDSSARAQTRQSARKITSYGTAGDGRYRVPIDTAKQLLLQEARTAGSSQPSGGE